MDLLKHLQNFKLKTNSADWDSGLVIGVSGGPDSLALLHLLRQLTERQTLRVHVAHFDHGLRPSSADDAQFVARIARRWGFPISVRRREVAMIASKRKISLEEAGRQARYAFLAKVAQREHHNLILVGHNANDQVETVLMHLLRGAGLSGLRGMSPLTPLDAMRLTTAAPIPAGLHLGRPLLSVTRDDIETYCYDNGLQPLRDASNSNTNLFRNRLRHEVWPLLVRENPNLSAALLRMTSVLREDQRVLQQATQDSWKDVLAGGDESRVLLHRSKFANLLPSLQRSLLRQAIMQLQPDLVDIGFESVSQAVDFCTSAEVRQQRSLPGDLALTIDYEHLMIAPTREVPRLPNGLPLMGRTAVIPLTIPGSTNLGDCGWQVRVDAYKHVCMKNIRANCDRWEAYVDADRIPGPLQLRTRRRGERFQPLGMNRGTQSLADFMTNARIPHACRNQLPLLVSGDRILWVPGWRLDQRASIQSDSRHIWHICMLPPACNR